MSKDEEEMLLECNHDLKEWDKNQAPQHILISILLTSFGGFN